MQLGSFVPEALPHFTPFPSTLPSRTPLILRHLEDFFLSILHFFFWTCSSCVIYVLMYFVRGRHPQSRHARSAQPTHSRHRFRNVLRLLLLAATARRYQTALSPEHPSHLPCWADFATTC